MLPSAAVSRPFLVIAEYLVGLVDKLKPVFRPGGLVFVRVLSQYETQITVFVRQADQRRLEDRY